MDTVTMVRDPLMLKLSLITAMGTMAILMLVMDIIMERDPLTLNQRLMLNPLPLLNLKLLLMLSLPQPLSLIMVTMAMVMLTLMPITMVITIAKGLLTLSPITAMVTTVIPMLVT